MRALRPAEIGFFRYCSERKQWEVILNNQPPLVLRRGMTAEQITQYSSSFVQIHQSYIINIDYLMIIKDSKCMLYPPFDKVTELLVSRKYKKEHARTDSACKVIKNYLVRELTPQVLVALT